MSLAALTSSLLLATQPAPAAAGSSAIAASSEPTPHERTASNVVFAEPLGNGLLYSLNYERLFGQWNVGLRAGASFFTYDVTRAAGSGNLTLFTFPLVASYYLGTEHHKLQLGLGATILHFAASRDSTGVKFEGAGAGLGVAATAVVGYRYFPRDSGLTFGVGFTPLLRATKGLLPWGGVSVGYVF